METASATAAALSLPVHPLPGVMEYDFGLCSGLTWKEIGDRFPTLVRELRNGRPEYPAYPGEEGREQFQERVCASLWQITHDLAGDRTVAVFTHGGPIVVFCLSVLGLPYRRPAPFAVGNASITTVEVGESRSALLSTNESCHLLE